MAVSTDAIKALREETGAGIMEAKRALQDADGDAQKAKKLLEQRGAAHAEKRSGREAAQGVVEPYVHLGGQLGVLVELNSETDFVSRTDEFREVAHEIALQIAANNPRYLSLDEIPENEAAELRQSFREEAAKAGKREDLLDRIADGKFKDYAKQHVLLEQPYIRDDSKTIKQLVQELSVRTRENIVIRRFARFQIGS
ncbi:MAG TPA: translation elongation factor Ts [Chloroflexota bacterium]|jgi:elongation factor Ts